MVRNTSLTSLFVFLSITLPSPMPVPDADLYPHTEVKRELAADRG
jgi:hypothetical protein